MNLFLVEFMMLALSILKLSPHLDFLMLCKDGRTRILC